MQKSLQTENETVDAALKMLPDWLNDSSCLMEVQRWQYDWTVIGKKIRERRLATGMSLRSAARWMSISATYLSDLERGLLPWSEARLKDITNVLDMAERSFTK
jgi:hypothetical protein